MMAKKIGLILLLILAAGWFAAGDSIAAQQWFTCRVVQAGPGGSLTYVRLTDTASSPAFTNKWFLAKTDRAKEMLAVVLTAMTNGMTVQVASDIDGAVQYPTINTMYIKP